jgi:hypothetical protein
MCGQFRLPNTWYTSSYTSALLLHRALIHAHKAYKYRRLVSTPKHVKRVVLAHPCLYETIIPVTCQNAKFTRRVHRNSTHIEHNPRCFCTSLGSQSNSILPRLWVQSQSIRPLILELQAASLSMAVSQYLSYDSTQKGTNSGQI